MRAIYRDFIIRYTPDLSRMRAVQQKLQPLLTGAGVSGKGGFAALGAAATDALGPMKQIGDMAVKTGNQITKAAGQVKQSGVKVCPS